MKYHYKHIVVVHGMGNQAPNETCLGFMNEFIRALPRNCKGKTCAEKTCAEKTCTEKTCAEKKENKYCVEVHNLISRVQLASEDSCSVSSKNSSGSAQQKPRKSFKPAYLTFRENSNCHVISFSEVYWKQIPDSDIRSNDGHLPIPIFTWFRSINTRLFPTADEKFHLSRQVIDNLEKMLRLAKSLFGYFNKSRDFVHLLERSLGDVQMYAESCHIRTKVNKRFLSVMNRIEEFKGNALTKLKEDTGNKCAELLKAVPETEIFIVAHSQGSVVAYNSLVTAAEGRRKDPNQHTWFPRIKALVTLGAPLDKHYTIWRNSFQTDSLKCTDCSNEPNEAEKKIAWFNYWDHSDPAGYGLKKLFSSSSANCQTDAQKLFKVKYDKGFTRYPIPGLAHIGYWKDKAIYEHIIDKVMCLGTTRSKTTVKGKWWRHFHRPMSCLGYIFGRLATLGIVMFCLTMMLTPIGCLSISTRLQEMLPLMSAPAFSFGASFEWFPHIEISYGILWVLGPLLLIKFSWTLYTCPCIRGWCAKLIYWIRNFLLVPILCTSILLFCLYHALQFPDVCKPEIGITEWFGYLFGLVIGCSLWRLHTVVHRGIVQMWRHTRGNNSQWENGGGCCRGK